MFQLYMMFMNMMFAAGSEPIIIILD